ncbi:DUF4450 domain-containing protein [Olivibacter sp. XZL3]|uniref:DUF4450 domain-containing protein n=1 Tax=Olivibacter sp. XZL3 TaxID=1735116 RepID=UPI001065C4EA|nr:DUF4450 domain-containing protein [Olivibacter sp. XZL3]
MIKKIHLLFLVTAISLSLSSNLSYAQRNENKHLWHGIERAIHYKPEGEDFVLVQGKRRFNRALYGTNTAFRVEAGDLPEFALYLPGMGGNLQFVLTDGTNYKRLIDADHIETRYRPGTMIYRIKDVLLGDGELTVQILAQAESEGLILRVKGKNITRSTKLWAVYGGASGQNFSRAGDIGADPESSFYLLPENCVTNVFNVHGRTFHLSFLNKKEQKQELFGAFSGKPSLKVLDAGKLNELPGLWTSSPSDSPLLSAKYVLKDQPLIYISIQREKNQTPLEVIFQRAEERRKSLTERVKLRTPDPYINTLGGALAIAADAIWESPTYLHGAVAWRMRLNAWRGAYVANPLGWHDRAKLHFTAYLGSQVLEPATGPVVPDTSRHLARQLEKMGTAVFSSGYISRNPNDNTKPHHYDMNLVFFDQLYSHFQYTGDTAFVKESWPAVKRHLAWEKRNFDQDGDGLYDAYCAIWASDALQYSGGGVTHTSAYNYRGFDMAAQLATIVGEDPRPYKQEAIKIKEAVNQHLWMNDKGWYAEYKDLLGEGLRHEQPGLWTIYHALDTRIATPFQKYQGLNYIDQHIPHIPVRAQGLPEQGLYTLSTTNWQPYTWSINNVALAENLQTALAYWQGGKPEEAFQLWKSNLVESMYLGASPGNFQQLSFYDAQRGELYRDFADPIGIAARTLTEGLFGILPDALADTLTIRPGLPSAWDKANLDIPDVSFSFERSGWLDHYEITPRFPRNMHLKLLLRARKAAVRHVKVNGKELTWNWVEESLERPTLQVLVPKAASYQIEIEWADKEIVELSYQDSVALGEELNLHISEAQIVDVYDPQQVLADFSNEKGTFSLRRIGKSMFFVKLRQENAQWWVPVNVRIKDAYRRKSPPEKVDKAKGRFEMLNLSKEFNGKVTELFKQRYLSPRPGAPTLQLPWQGVGNWCYPLIEPVLDDQGIKRLAKAQGHILLPNDVPIKVSADGNDIMLTSQWDNYPTKKTFALSGKASHVYFLVAGTTNPMQSQFTNGMLTIVYADGTKEELELRNPDNWWPIEQDYEDDGYAFSLPKDKPYRLHLKTGRVVRGGEGSYYEIKGFTKRAIDGGAATLLELPLDPTKELKTLELRTIANDVVIGLMGMTLEVVE